MTILNEPHKILIIRFSSLGDVILTTALPPNLKAQWPRSEITVLTKKSTAPVYDNNPSVDRVMAFDETSETFSQLVQRVRQEKFDVIIDLHVNLRSWLLRFFAGPPVMARVQKAWWARQVLLLFKKRLSSLDVSVRERILGTLKSLDVPCVHTETVLFPSATEAVLEKFALGGGQRLVGFAPGAKHNTKRWNVAQFAEAANRLGVTPNTCVVIVGDKSDRSVADEMSVLLKIPYKNLAGKTTMQELIALTSQFSFLLTNDSGLLHMGEALNIPLVALFGPTVRAFGFAPYKKTSRVVEVVNLRCRPCSLHGDDRCPLRHHHCMDDIDINAVLYAASSVYDAAS